MEGELTEGLAKAPAEQWSYELDLRAAMEPITPPKRPRGPPAGPSQGPQAPNRTPEPPVDAPITLEPLDATRPASGTKLALPRAMWPDYPCDELGLGGLGAPG